MSRCRVFGHAAGSGCYEQYIAFPEDMCFKLPENMSTLEGCLIEPLSVGFYAANQGEVQTGDTVVIWEQVVSVW